MKPTLLNPGSLQYLKVATINCQGLIPFKELSSDHPSLDITKMAELNSYLATQNPDILMLNETWLKKSIKKVNFFLLTYIKLSVLIAQILNTPLIQIILASLGAMVAVSLYSYSHSEGH